MFGITEQDIKKLDKKINKQKDFLSNGVIDIEGFDKRLIDFVYSANINPKKYFSEVNNRVNSIMNITTSMGLAPVFITITAPSEYHKVNEKGELIVDPNETAKALTGMFNDFTNTSIFKRIRKEYDRGFHYMRTYEPHKSGVPHLHAVLFIPVKYVKPLKERFYTYFTDKQRWGNSRDGLDYKYEFEGGHKGVVRYIMKYILKTFKNEDNESLQYASYWFLKHRIRRFLTSRNTLIPLYLFRRIRHYLKKKGYKHDLEMATKMYLNNQIFFAISGKSKDFNNPEYNKNILYLRYYDHENQTVEEEILWSKCFLRSIGANNSKKNDAIKLKYKKKESKKPLIVTVDGKPKYIYSKKQEKFVEIQIPVAKMSDYQLLGYYKKVDKFPSNDQDLFRYLVAYNEMVKRSLISGSIVPLVVSDIKGDL